MKTNSLEGKVALVTSGSRGIGAAIARRLGADGAKVALTYANRPDAAVAVVKSIEAAGGKAIAIQADGDGGRIINIGSINSDSVPFAGIAMYAMSKAAVAGLTKGLARDLAARGITVNNVQPGPVDTDMNPDSGDFAAAAREYTALKRYGKSEEIADFVAYIASPGSGYITGASLAVDGGWTA